MTEILFYHLERTGLDHVLPGMLEKSLERGWRAVVRAGSQAKVEALDNHLWTYRDDSFLPHGAGGEGEASPVWLTDTDATPEDRQILFLVEGAKADPADIQSLDRCVMIFDGRNDDAVADARGFWKAAKAFDHDVTYWKQSSEGRWEKQG